MGCKGPTTYNACSVTKWNQGLGYPIQAGHGCIGCSEEAFWDKGPFYERLPQFPGFGIESTADTIGATATVVTAGGIALHAIGSAIRKRKVIHENMEESVNLPHESKAPVESSNGKNGGDAS
jgi:hydrogenase small subunit